MVATLAAPPTIRPTSRTLPVAEVIAIVQEWVDREASRRPDFAGAYLFGSITTLPLDTPFALYRDVDVIVVSASGTKDMADNLEMFYRGLMIEVGFRSLEEHASPDSILASPDIGPNFATTTILADPRGVLAPLQQAVAAEFAQQRWARARCESEKVWTLENLATMRAVPAADRLVPTWFFLNELCSVLALARLARPTHRRTLTLLRELLEEQGRLDLHERALAVWGSAGMSRESAHATLDETEIVFDRAVEVVRTPTLGSFKLHAHLRPYLIDAGQAMIDDGFPREAMFWIGGVHQICTTVLRNDAPEDEKPLFEAQAHHLNDALGFSSDATWDDRVAGAEQLAQEIFRMADELVALLPA